MDLPLVNSGGSCARFYIAKLNFATLGKSPVYASILVVNYSSHECAGKMTARLGDDTHHGYGSIEPSAAGGFNPRVIGRCVVWC